MQNRADYRILTFKIIFDIRTEAKYRTFTSKSYFDIQNRAKYHILTFLKVCNWAVEGL